MRLALALMVVLAGCVSSPTSDDDPDAGEELPPMNFVTAGEGTIVISAGGLSASQGGGDVIVEEGARLLYVEWAWDDPVVDLDGALSSPSAGDTEGVANIDHTAPGGAPGAPDSPHGLAISTPEVGTWRVSMTANAAANTEYRYAATVFFDTDAVPEGYSAL